MKYLNKSTIKPYLKMLDPFFYFSRDNILRLLELWRFPTPSDLAGALDVFTKTLNPELGEYVCGQQIWPAWHWQQTTPQDAAQENEMAWQAIWSGQSSEPCSIIKHSGEADSPFSISSRIFQAQHALRIGHDPTSSMKPTQWLQRSALDQGLAFSDTEIELDRFYSVIEAARLFGQENQPAKRAWLYYLAASNHFSPCGEEECPTLTNGLFIPRWTGKSWLGADPSNIWPMLGQMRGRPDLIDCLDYYPEAQHRQASIMMAMFLTWIWQHKLHVDNEEYRDWVPSAFLKNRTGSFFDLAENVFDGEITTEELNPKGLDITRAIYANFQQVFRHIAIDVPDMDSWDVYNQLTNLLDVFRS